MSRMTLDIFQSRTLGPEASSEGGSELEIRISFGFRHSDFGFPLAPWPHDGTFEAFAQLDLLLEIRAVLRKYERLLL